MEQIYKSYAKINLGLEIISKRPDGYHEINSVFLPITLFDEIHFSSFDKLQITVEPENIKIPLKENLIYKTIKLIQNKYKININCINVHLKKKIPIGAGLGGGSSNAATTLIALNKIFNLDLSVVELKNLAVQIGADVPFFIEPKPSIVRGIGDKIEPIDFPFDFNLLLVVPNFSINTKYAYSLIKNVQERTPTDFGKILTQIKVLSEFAEYFTNDFEQYLLPKYPQIKEIKNKLTQIGAKYTSLSGSGSTIFGCFENDFEVNEVRKIFSNENVILCKVMN
ncbi:MAG: 4-(cytidine 5'-diphospho)-2-C-methyl-D-erythritol kinase [Ignavibacteria bacterium]|nr:4-(cytidine 5'-diphospho)-2-C-methyl-D-erythritol kinase [Ignavibacteria bacterium]